MLSNIPAISILYIDEYNKRMIAVITQEGRVMIDISDAWVYVRMLLHLNVTRSFDLFESGSGLSEQ
jgi:hypothetical protein